MKVFYSYYVCTAPHSRETCKAMTSYYGYCGYCGYWKIAVNFNSIPERLRSVKGAWRKHVEYSDIWDKLRHKLFDLLEANKTKE